MQSCEINVPGVGPGTAKDILQELFVNDFRWGAFLWGPPGVGKSAIIKQITIEQGWDFKDVRLLTLNPVDLRGIPVPDMEKQIARWLVPSFMPRSGQGILFLDELNAAPPSLQAAAYQLVLDRRVGEYRVPDGWRIVAAGNRQVDQAVVYKMPKPLANRIVHLQVQADLEEWKIWAYKNNIHPTVIAFLNSRPELLFKAPKAEVAFPSPRSWEMASDVIKIFSNPDASTTYVVVAGCVGEAAATEFIAFWQNSRTLPDVDAILRGQDFKPPEEPDALYALVAAITAKAAANPTQQVIYNAVRGLTKLPDEFAMLGIKDLKMQGLTQQLKAALNSPSLRAWAQEKVKLVI